MNGSNDLSPLIGGHLAQWDLRALDEIGGTSGTFGDWVMRAVSGELDLSLGGIAHSVLQLFFAELWQNGAVIRQLLLIALLSALIRCLTDSFKTKAVGELGFYVCYVLAIATVLTSFRMATGILLGLVTQTTGMMEAAVPLMIGLTALSGNVGSAALLHPVILLGMTLTARFIAEVFIPLVTVAVVLHIVNHLVEGNIFAKFLALLKRIANWLLKGLVFLFLALLALQRISAPIANNLALRTARAAAGAVPVVGGALNSALDTVLHLSSAARSGVLVALVIVLCVAVSVPLLKLLAFQFTYRLTAALIQPVCDERIVSCLDGLGEFTGMLLMAGILVALMFVFTCVILLAF